MPFKLPISSIDPTSNGVTATPGQMLKAGSNDDVIASSALYESGGLVGISNTSPAYTLDVTGTLRVTSNAVLTTYTEAESSPSISTNTLTLNLATSTIFNVTLNANITTLSITNIPATSGVVSGFVIIFTGSGSAYSVTWPTSSPNIRWPNGVAPALTSTTGKRDVLTFFTTDNGSTYNAFISGQNI